MPRGIAFDPIGPGRSTPGEGAPSLAGNGADFARRASFDCEHGRIANRERENARVRRGEQVTKS